MKTLFVIVLGVLLALPALADSHEGKEAKGSKEFERLKKLVGTWTGKMDMGEGKADFTTTYRLVAGGSVLEERIFADTPKEMVTMYHDKGGKVVMTHYCMLGNQPSLVLKKATDETLSFDFDPSCGIDASKEMHMHAMDLTFVDDDTIKQEWVLYIEGKPQDKHPFTLKRVKK